ncbi:MAG: VanZ family protein [Bacteroidota bacterium]|nr:VanZ family protein [Bacteroidota bacterium]
MVKHRMVLQLYCKYHIFSVLCGIMILILCVIRIPQNNELDSIPYIDKVVHFCMYFTFSLLYILESFRSDPEKKRKPAGLLIKAGLLSLLIGGGIEIIQSTLTDYRTGDIIDLCFDMGGALSGIIVAILFRLATIKRGH